MLRRVAAWLLIVGFIFLIFNIIVFHFYWEASLAVYLVIMLSFVVFNNHKRYNNINDETDDTNSEEE